MTLPAQTKRRDLIQGLKKLGFDGPHLTGRNSAHPAFMRKGTLTVPIPNPHRQDIGRNLLGDILRKAGINDDDWSAAIQKHTRSDHGETDRQDREKRAGQE